MIIKRSTEDLKGHIIAGHILSELNYLLNRLLQMLERFEENFRQHSLGKKSKKSTPDLALTSDVQSLTYLGEFHLGPLMGICASAEQLSTVLLQVMAKSCSKRALKAHL